MLKINLESKLPSFNKSVSKQKLKLDDVCAAALCLALVSFAPEVMAATDDLKSVAEGVHKIATGSGMKIGLIAASVSCIVAGLINNAILKPMMALGGVAGSAPLVLDWINTKYTFLI